VRHVGHLPRIIMLRVSIGSNIKSQGFKELGEFTKQVSSTEFGGREESKKGHSEYKSGDSNIHREFWIIKSIQ
jgi:hypothetical protein